MGWRPAQPGDPAGAYPYLTTLGQAGPHGGAFTYRSADSAARTVVVKLSSWPDPQHTAYLLDTLRACAARAARLDARD